MPEEVAEIKLARKIQLSGDILDGVPLVGEQQAGLVQPGALDVFMDGALAGGVKQGAQAGIADLADQGEFLRLPVAERVGGDGIQNADDGFGQLRVGRIQEMPGHEQLAEQAGDDDVHLPFPARRATPHQPQELNLCAFHRAKILQNKLGVFPVSEFLMPEFQARPAKPEAGDGQRPAGRGDVRARFPHVHQPSL